MDQDRFDDLARSLTTATPRRSAVRGLAGGLLAGVFSWHSNHGAEANDKLKKCKKFEGDKKKKCIKKAKKHKDQPANESPQPIVCGGVTCPDGQVCCPDQKCGARCCANGEACNVVCSGPNGNNYCCDASRPVAICGGCWTLGSTQCDDPKHCCSPESPKCCGNDHCCAPGWECLVGCPGNTCCKGGQSATCCPNGTPG